MRAKLWPTGLIGRVGLVLFAAIVLELVVSTLVFEHAELVSSEDAQIKRLATQLDVATRVLDAASRTQRAGVAGILSEPGLSFQYNLPTPGDAGREIPAAPPLADAHAQLLSTKLLAEDPALAGRHLALDPATAEATIAGHLVLDDGSLVGFRADTPAQAPPSLLGQIASVALLSGGVLLAALIVVRTLAAPLRMLVRATDAIGLGPPVHLDDTQGPREIRRVALAFNAMQARIAKLLKDRTDALAAVSHDLRTPIARIRLRADIGGQKDASAADADAIAGDLAEMEAMLDDLNAYLRGETDPETPKRTDIAAILQTLVDDATDAGKLATYTGPDRLTLTIRARALKRALSNLVGNALIYGDRANVALEWTNGRVTIIVEDDGPGIPEAELRMVLEPFYRGDAARNRSKGGMGLGLAIAHAAIAREQGTLALENRPQGGLRVRVTLPGS